MGSLKKPDRALVKIIYEDENGPRCPICHSSLQRK